MLESYIVEQNIESKTISWLRFVMAALVVILHAKDWFYPSGEYIYYNLIRIVVSDGVCRLAVPTFFLISGYLYYKNIHKFSSIYDFWKNQNLKRIKSLLIPYLLWNIIGIVLFVSSVFILQGVDAALDFCENRGWHMMLWNNNRIGENLNDNINILGLLMHGSVPINGPLWFIRDLFILNILSPLIYYVVKKMGGYWLFLMSIFYIFNIWIPFEGFSASGFYFFSLGCFLQLKNKMLHNAFANYYKYIGLISFILFAFMVFMYNESLMYSKILLRAFTVFGSLFLLYVVSVGIKHNKLKVYTKLNDSSFFIFALHMLIIPSIIIRVFNFILPFENEMIFILKYIGASFVDILACILIFYVCKMHFPKVTSILSGGR